MFSLYRLQFTCLFLDLGAKSVSMHPLVYHAARQRFLASSIHTMEAEHVNESERYYQNQPWYRRFNGFSAQACLQKHRISAGHGEPMADLSLPRMILNRYNHGIDISSVFNEKQPTKEGFWVPNDMDKMQYLQGHIMRTVSTLCDQISVTKADLSGRSVKKSLLMHLQYILNNQPIELVGLSKQIEGYQTVASCHASLYKDLEKSKNILEDVLNMQKSSTVTDSLDVAKTMSKIAEIYHALEENEKAKSLLEEAAELYEVDRRKCGEYKRSLEFGKLLGLLGVVYGSINLKRESKETIERSLMLLQAAPPDFADEAKSKQYGAEFASSLTDLGHAYVSLGMPLYGKKILDLALSALKNLHGDNHAEVVRAMTVLGIAHLMQGHNEESNRIRKEAGKLQAAVNKVPCY